MDDPATNSYVEKQSFVAKSLMQHYKQRMGRAFPGHSSLVQRAVFESHKGAKELQSACTALWNYEEKRRTDRIKRREQLQGELSGSKPEEEEALEGEENSLQVRCNVGFVLDGMEAKVGLAVKYNVDDCADASDEDEVAMEEEEGVVMNDVGSDVLEDAAGCANGMVDLNSLAVKGQLERGKKQKVSKSRPWCPMCKKHICKLKRHLKSGVHSMDPTQIATISYDCRKGKRDKYKLCPIESCPKKEPTTRLDYHLNTFHNVSKKDTPAAFEALMKKAVRMKDLVG